MIKFVFCFVELFFYQVIDRDEHVNLHFVCFVNVNDELYELDGRHPHPIKHLVKEQPLDLLRVF